MELDELVARTAIAFFAVLGALLVFTSLAHCEPPSLRERLEHAQTLPGVTNPKEPPVDRFELAQTIERASNGNRTLAVLMLVMAATETRLAARIERGECRANECDHGKAVGLWQSHSLGPGARLPEQAERAALELRRAVSMCHGLPFPLAAMRAYGSGGGCHSPIPREVERLELYARVRRAVL